jgi:hypothetical protein
MEVTKLKLFHPVEKDTLCCELDPMFLMKTSSNVCGFLMFGIIFLTAGVVGVCRGREESQGF